MTTNLIPAGTTVRIRPECHRAGETGTVVRVPASVIAEHGLRIIPGTIPVALASVSGLPLWYGPEELEVLSAEEGAVWVVIERHNGAIVHVEILDAAPEWNLEELGQECYSGNVNGGDSIRVS